jgi:mannose-6-phosphate isomerase-like protein (cupin superfamily)
MSLYLDADKFMDWILELITDNEAKPYIDERISESVWIRTFDPFVTESEEYVWHRDENDRIVTVLEGEGWQFQFDNDIPKIINRNETIIVPKMVYHRLLVGKTPLKLRIEEVVDVIY